jgi:hypothetical protein
VLHFCWFCCCSFSDYSPFELFLLLSLSSCLPLSPVFSRFNEDKDEFLNRVSKVVQESIQRMYDQITPSNPLVFVEPKPAHEELIKEIFFKRNLQNVDRDPLGEELKSDKADEHSSAASSTSGHSPLHSDRFEDLLDAVATTTNTAHDDSMSMNNDISSYLHGTSDDQIADLSVDSMNNQVISSATPSSSTKSSVVEE